MTKRFAFGLLLLAAINLQAQFLNNGFESGMEQWRVWSRTSGAIQAKADTANAHAGRHSGMIEHTGTGDWSLEPALRLKTSPNELYEMEIWVRAEGEGNATFCASTWDATGKAVDWSYADREAAVGAGWNKISTRIFVPAGISEVQPRLIGYGKLRVWVDDFLLRKVDEPRLKPGGAIPAMLSISNTHLVVTLVTQTGAFDVTDRRTGRVWRQSAEPGPVVVTDAAADSGSIRLKLFDGSSGQEMSAGVELAADAPELAVSVCGDGKLSRPLRFPHPFKTQGGDYLVIPMNEGISYPAEDQTVPLHRLIAYGGHGICMAFWGVTDGRAGHMAIIETPDDAAIRTERLEGNLIVVPEWDPQKGAFGYARRLRYVFFDHGGHVAMAKRYRNYARTLGLVRTLEEKRKVNPGVDLLVGAVNVWCWDRDSVAIVKEMKSAGIERILWSNAQPPEKLHALNELGVLTSRYDIYQDVMNPGEFDKLQWKHPDWTTAAWPDDIIRRGNGEWIKGWGVEAKDGSMVSCGVLCDRRALDYARERVPAELLTHPYKCRFIDTTTAAPWHECYDQRHPMTRTESKQWKMKLLQYMCEDQKLVTGSETGHDAAVPYTHYFEGMLSLGPYRVPDSGRKMQVIWTNVPDVVAKFQVGHNYRLPLWELVYHDCTIAQWYWGDYNNKLPALWDQRDLFNVLYGTPPMFMFTRKLWTENQARFVQSYKNICPTVRQIGYAEMTDHQFLTDDRSVQQTAFSTGQKVIVNFGKRPFRLPSGKELAPMSHLLLQ